MSEAGPDFVARFDQEQARALDAIRRADAFLIFTANNIEAEPTLVAHVCCPPEMLAWCADLLGGMDDRDG